MARDDAGRPRHTWRRSHSLGHSFDTAGIRRRQSRAACRRTIYQNAVARHGQKNRYVYAKKRLARTRRTQTPGWLLANLRKTVSIEDADIFLDQAQADRPSLALLPSIVS